MVTFCPHVVRNTPPRGVGQSLGRSTSQTVAWLNFFFRTSAFWAKKNVFEGSKKDHFSPLTLQEACNAR